MKMPVYRCFPYESHPKQTSKLETDSVACRRQWETVRRAPRIPLRLNDRVPAVDAVVVLARFDEDVAWILSYPRCRFCVYNKGGPLPRAVAAHARLEVVAAPNRGREGGAYVDYVRAHYDALPAVVVLSQAAPLDKAPDFYRFLDAVLAGDAVVDGYLPLGTRKFVPRWMATHPGHGVVQMYPTLFARRWAYDLWFPHGATMAVARAAIVARSRTFWDVAHYLVDHDHGGPAARAAGCPANADATWGLEKCWPVVFDGGRTPANPLVAPPPPPPKRAALLAAALAGAALGAAAAVLATRAARRPG